MSFKQTICFENIWNKKFLVFKRVAINRQNKDCDGWKNATQEKKLKDV